MEAECRMDSADAYIDAAMDDSGQQRGCSIEDDDAAFDAATAAAASERLAEEVARNRVTAKTYYSHQSNKSLIHYDGKSIALFLLHN